MELKYVDHVQKESYEDYKSYTIKCWKLLLKWGQLTLCTPVQK